MDRVITDSCRSTGTIDGRVLGEGGAQSICSECVCVCFLAHAVPMNRLFFLSDKQEGEQEFMLPTLPC